MSASHWRNNIAALFGIWRRSLRAGSIDAAQYRFQVEQVARAAELELRRIDKEQQMKVAVVILAGLSLSAACSGSNPTGPTGTYAPTPLSDGSARVTTMSVLDQPLVNSCDTSSFRIHQKNGEHGQLATVFEERPGPFNTAWDVEYQRRNNVKGKPNDYEGALTLRARGYTSIVEVQINNGGVYRGRMRGNRCSNWSAWIEFTIGPNPEQEVEPEPVCEGIVTPNGCLVREDE